MVPVSSNSLLFTMLKNSTSRTTINTYSGMNFTYLTGFGYLIDTNTTYYALDYSANRIIIFDQNWQYLTFKSFIRPVRMVTINSALYISCQLHVYKTDKNLNISSQYNSSTDDYRGLYYNSLNNTIYVAGFTKCVIYVFDLNLNLVDSITNLTDNPVSIQGYKNYIYVGTNSGLLLVIENKIIIKTFHPCVLAFLSSIQIDHFGYMVLSCHYDRKANLYYSSNVSYTNKSLTYEVNPYFINFDLNGRFVVISNYQIDIYY